MNDKKYSVAEMWMAKRIAEFPTLYSNKNDVIAYCVLGSQGSTHWNKSGTITSEDQHYNSKSRKFEPYPLRIPLKQALGLLNNTVAKTLCLPPFFGGPINRIPLNAHQSWLDEISSFLHHWSRLTLEDYRLMATTRCLLSWGIRENPHAGEPSRTFSYYEEFLKKAPSWEADIRNVEYQRRMGKIDPKTYQGMYI